MSIEVTQREAIARIIDPEAWKLIDHWGDMACLPDLVFRVKAKAAPSLTKADAILALHAAPLREALKPFAERCTEAVRPDDDDTMGVTVRVKHLRAALAALSPSYPMENNNGD